MVDPRVDSVFILHTVFIVVHLVYFIIYNGRYSSLNHRLVGIEKMEQAGVADQEIIDRSKKSVQTKIKKLKKWSYFLVLCIASIHLVSFVSRNTPTRYRQFIVNNEVILQKINTFTSSSYWTLVFITIGSALLILAANYIKGAQIIDPNKRYGRYFTWR